MGKIVVVSFFKSSNLGDLLIAQNVAEIFGTKYDCEYRDMDFSKIELSEWGKRENLEPEPKISTLVWLKRKILKIPVFGDWLISLKSKKSSLPNRAIESCESGDMVVFAGGNSIMDLGYFPAQIRTAYDTVKRLKGKGVKVVYCFCGVGPFRAKKSLKIAKDLFREIDFISVRDEASYELIKEALPEKVVEIWRDPVLLKPQKQVEKSDKNAIGVNVYFGCEPSRARKAKKAFIRIVSEWRSRYPNEEIKLFSSEYRDYKDVAKVKKAFINDDKVKTVLIKNEKELFAFYEQVDGIIGTRMHTIITSLVSGMASVTLSWQKKVESLSQLFGNTEFNFTVSQFTSNPLGVVERFEECLRERAEIVAKNQEMLAVIRSETAEKIAKF